MDSAHAFSDDQITSAAKAMILAANDFRDPVTLYVRGEYRERWYGANPEKEFDDEHDIFGSEDEDFEELESWKILARAALEALT